MKIILKRHGIDLVTCLGDSGLPFGYVFIRNWLKMEMVIVVESFLRDENDKPVYEDSEHYKYPLSIGLFLDKVRIKMILIRDNYAYSFLMYSETNQRTPFLFLLSNLIDLVSAVHNLDEESWISHLEVASIAKERSEFIFSDTFIGNRDSIYREVTNHLNVARNLFEEELGSCYLAYPPHHFRRNKVVRDVNSSRKRGMRKRKL